MADWTKLLEKDIELKVMTKVLPKKGNLVYEYNPFRNYRLSQNMYEFKDSLYSMYELYNIYGILIDIDYADYQSSTGNRGASGTPQTSNSVYQYKDGYFYYYKAATPAEINALLSNEDTKEVEGAKEYKLVINDLYYDGGYWTGDGSLVTQRLGESGLKSDDYILLSEVLDYCYSKEMLTSRTSFETAISECSFPQWADSEVINTNTDPILREKGELVDFITDELSFSLSNPVTIVPQYSYDGSVNLILNDGLNIPRLINSRFSATGKNTYEIVDRRGNNDTNIYDQGEQFDIDTSLFKRVIKIPKLEFKGVVSGGNLFVGQYHFYFKFADADGNETDFVAESGLVSVFLGFGDATCVQTGVADENSVKAVKFYMTNIDSAYNYVYVYYSRSSAGPGESAVTTYFKVLKKFVVLNDASCTILVTGFEDTKAITLTELNMTYALPDAVSTAVSCKNMLILGNIHRQEIPYDELQDLSLRFLPYVKEVQYPFTNDHEYTNDTTSLGYYDPKFIYSSVGYWADEYYRLGIVYILPNNELTPVFNIRGRHGAPMWGIKKVDGVKGEIEDVIDEEDGDIHVAVAKKTAGMKAATGDLDEEEEEEEPDNLVEAEKIIVPNVNDGRYHHFPVYKEDDQGNLTRNYINIEEATSYVIQPDSSDGIAATDPDYWENAKGVCTFDPPDDINQIYAIDIRVDDDTIQELKKYVKGYFFVRQHRIPTILCQGLVIGLDNNACIPTIPVWGSEEGGVLNEIKESLEDSTYIEVEDINDVNYISESFISRYQYTLEKKKNSFWSVFGKIMIAVAVVAAVAAASIVTCGGVAVAGAILVPVLISAETMITALEITAGVVAAIAVTSALVGAATQAHLHRVQKQNKDAASIKQLDGRNATIPSGYERKESSSSRQIVEDFKDRIIIMDPKKNSPSAVLCPDFEVDQPYYNQIFTGGEFTVKTGYCQTTAQATTGYAAYSDFFRSDNNHFYLQDYADFDTVSTYKCRIQAVPEDVKVVMIGTQKFRSRAGMAEESWHYECVGQDWEEDKDKTINADIVRGIYGPYLGITDYAGRVCDTINIMIPGYSDTNISEYIEIRATDHSPFFAISERYAMEDIDDQLNIPLSNIEGTEDRSNGYSWELYRGDCYICQFTHRLNRNFNDPSAPYNDTIIDEDTWKDNYDVTKPEQLEDINLGDVNATPLGMWVTFRVRSNYNLNIRTIDNSYVEEKLMSGHGRGYYPYLPLCTEGSFKTPESSLYNAGFHESLSSRYNMELADVPYLKNWFGTRIMYSDMHVNDAFKNGFRVFQSTHFIDCPRTYGEITKIVEVGGALLVVFEHGVGYTTVGADGIAEPKMISTKFGSQWPESIIVTDGVDDSETQVYGVDTVAKKIWTCKGGTLNCISDMRVEEFLINNITLGERELTPIIGIRNVKTAYNAFKKDVLFTFYDNLEGFEEKVWNLCWNEILGEFITFYSWVPSYMENINNMPFSFNRNTSKWIAKLGVSHADNSFADGVTLTNNIMENEWDSTTEGTGATSFKATIYKGNGTLEEVVLQPDYDGNHITKDGNEYFETFEEQGNVNNQWFYYDKDYKDGLIGILGVAGINLPIGTNILYKVDYSIERDNFRNDKLFEIKKIGYYINNYNTYTEGGSVSAGINRIKIPVYGLYLKEGVTVYDLATEMYYRNIAGNSYSDWDTNKKQIWDEAIPTMKDLISKNFPIFKNRKGQRLMLESRDDMVNPTHIVRLLNIKAKIYSYYLNMENTLTDSYYMNYANSDATDTAPVDMNIDTGAESDVDPSVFKDTDVVVINGFSNNGSSGQWVDCGYYESVVAVIPRWNMQFLSTDFWKHGQAGIIDIADKLYPAYWYGEQHPFEIEFVVANDASVHKIFTNLMIVSNNVKPESFHFEIAGDVYDFAKDKVNMYFRQEAMKALYQYNGADILYNNNFLDTTPKQNKVSADLPHEYYARYDTFNDVYSSYKQAHSANKDYDHISGSEIVYYPTRSEYRVWVHQKAVSMDDFEGDSTQKLMENGEYLYEEDAWENARSLVASNCKYVEDRWIVTINPIVVCYKNEYNLKDNPGNLTSSNSTWNPSNLPPLPVFNSPLPLDNEGERILSGANATITNDDFPKDLANIGYTVDSLDPTRWLDDIDIHGYRWGGENTGCNREELDIKDKFVKVRIRYTGNQLVIIDFINTIYQLSKA